MFPSSVVEWFVHDHWVFLREIFSSCVVGGSGGFGCQFLFLLAMGLLFRYLSFLGFLVLLLFLGFGAVLSCLDLAV
ncbi:hypothetical protein BDR26DRAFT_859421 [Obelidium mucronatum]|nr:hypothetical protein BDR26DRAFT_859421 [Obelidium mucronatum]